MTTEIPVVLVKWETLVGELLDCTLKFPKAVRFTFATRIDTLALDTLDALLRARWAKGATKVNALREADLHLMRLRVMLRLAHARRYAPHAAHERLQRGIDEVGRMVGGWLRQVDGAEA